MAPSPKQLADFFTRSLASFAASPDEALRVLCTLPHGGDEPGPRRAGPERPVRRLVVLDSSFNPPTRAHGRMARTAVAAAAAGDGDAGTGKGDAGAGEGDAGAARRLLLLLAVRNADKAPQPAGFAARLAMMEGLGEHLLRGDEAGGLEVDVGVTRAVLFHAKAGAVAATGFYGGAEMVFATGFDTLERILDARYYGGTAAGMRAALGPLFARARLRVTLRPDGARGAAEQRAWVRALGAGGGLAALAGEPAWGRRVDDDGDARLAGVSSSRARELVRSRQRVDGLVDAEVCAWIEREGLYRDEGQEEALAMME